ncbi:MAG TPA: hypothetical protein VJ697_14640 [Nitrososphaeraceae archaeon]|nr:hypothetical protein [Nitrososphaeraceae archaeon]
MSTYKLENKIKSMSTFCCEFCGLKQGQVGKEERVMTIIESVNEFYKDGTVKIHYSCSSHIVELYKKITRKIEKNQN